MQIIEEHPASREVVADVRIIDALEDDLQSLDGSNISRFSISGNIRYYLILNTTYRNQSIFNLDWYFVSHNCFIYN